MCVIAFSKKGVDIPSEETMKKMWTHNPDGAGYAYEKNGRIIYRKGFMTFDSLLKDIGDPQRFKHTNFAIHFRIGTSGKNDPHTCHPFPISTSFGDLRRTHGKESSVLFHNGIIGEGGITDKLASDTQDFVVATAPLLYKYNKSKARDALLEDIVEGSRILVLYKGNKYKMYGRWQQDGDLIVSNTSYKDSYYGYYGYSSTQAQSQTSQDYYGESEKWWENWYEEQARKKAEAEAKTEATIATSTALANTHAYNFERADSLYADIIKCQYKFVSDDELELLQACCDGYTSHEIEYSGFIFGYDKEQKLVWLEEEVEM